MPKEQPNANNEMQATLSVLSLLLGGFTRSPPSAAAKQLFAKYVPGILAQFKKYKLPFPKTEFKKVNTAFMASKTKNLDYFHSLQAFTKLFAPAFRKKANEDPSLDNNIRLLINYTFSMCNTGDVGKHAGYEVNYQKNLRYLTDQKVRNLYPAKFETPTDAYKQVEELVRKVTGKPGYFLTTEQLKKLQATKPQLYKTYADLHKPIKVAYNLALKKIIPDSQPIPVQEARDKLTKLGVKAHYLDPQYDKLGLKVNDVNKLFTKEGRELRTNPRPGMTIRINPNYDPKTNTGRPIQYYDPTNPKNKNPDGTPNWLYLETIDHAKQREGDKAERHASDEEALPAARKSWLADFRNPDIGENEYNYVLGLMTEIMHAYAQRIGNPGNKTVDKKTGEENETFGLTTLTAGNVKLGKVGKSKLPTVEITYPGKDNIDQGFFVDPNKGKEQKEIVEGILWLLEDYDGNRKKPDEPLFTVQGKRITSNALGTYVKSKGISKPHSFRHLKADALAKPILAKAPKFASSKEANKWLKEAMKPVGEALGHIRTDKATGEQKSTSSTVLKSYIPTSTIQKFFTDRKLIVPDEYKR